MHALRVWSWPVEINGKFPINRSSARSSSPLGWYLQASSHWGSLGFRKTKAQVLLLKPVAGRIRLCAENLPAHVGVFLMERVFVTRQQFCFAPPRGVTSAGPQAFVLGHVVPVTTRCGGLVLTNLCKICPLCVGLERNASHTDEVTLPQCVGIIRRRFSICRITDAVFLGFPGDPRAL